LQEGCGAGNVPRGLTNPVAEIRLRGYARRRHQDSSADRSAILLASIPPTSPGMSTV
jgi:hypothetical protein